MSEKFFVMLLLSPGFFAMTALSLLTDMGDVGEVRLVYYSFVLTVLAVFVTYVFLQVFQFLFRLKILNERGPALAALATLSVLLGLAIGTGLAYASERGADFAVARGMGFNFTRISRLDPVTVFLSENSRPGSKQAYARVAMKDGHIYEGLPKRFRLETGKTSQLHLAPACQSKSATEALFVVKGPGVIVYESEIQSITMLDRANSECFCKYSPQEGCVAASKN